MLKNGHAGLLDTDYINDGEALNTQLTLRGNGNNADYLTAPNTYRGSGNDITKQKVSELEDYIKAGFPVVFSGGVASNSQLRESCRDFDAIFSPPEYSTDNAMGIAVLTWLQGV